MITFNVIQVTDSATFNWAFTQVIVFFPVLFTVKATIRVFSRS